MISIHGRKIHTDTILKTSWRVLCSIIIKGREMERVSDRNKGEMAMKISSAGQKTKDMKTRHKHEKKKITWN